MRFSVMLRTLLAAVLLLGLGAVPLRLAGEHAAALEAPANSAGESEMPEAFSLLPRLCPTAGPVGETEGDRCLRGVLVVPENDDDPTDPIVYLEGGPGGNAVDQAAGYAEGFADRRAPRDVILFNQRGTEYSGRLDCTPYQVALDYLIETDAEVTAIFSADITPSFAVEG
ncbi:MAG: hypothetical protein ACRDJH_03690 [Thermomicrobiales bacterium]